MTKEQIDLLINPPIVVGPDTVVLCPPVATTEAYMKYLKDNREHYRRFFGLEED